MGLPLPPDHSGDLVCWVRWSFRALPDDVCFEGPVLPIDLERWSIQQRWTLLLTHIFRHWLGGKWLGALPDGALPFYRDEQIPPKLSPNTENSPTRSLKRRGMESHSRF